MSLILQTERLLIREHAPEDALALHRLNTDPEVMRYTHEEPSPGVEAMRQAILDYPDYKRYGYGRWTVEYEAQVIGFAGPKYLEELGETDVGYRLLPNFWGRGLATEAVQAIAEHCFRRIRLPRLIGLVLPDNIASIRVLEKCGFLFERAIDYDGVIARKYVKESARQ